LFKAIFDWVLELVGERVKGMRLEAEGFFCRDNSSDGHSEEDILGE
jgi:hypothetical protein